MALVKIADLYPNYKEDIFGGDDIKSFSVYDYGNDKIGSVYDIIVDETGKFRYLVIDTGFWIFGKKVLLPVGRASIDYNDQRVYASGLTKEQAENLPQYDDDMTINYDYEERVRRTYRGVEYDKDNTVYSESAQGYDSGAYTRDSDVELYQTNRANHGDIVSYQENFKNNRDRFKLRSGTNVYEIGDLDSNYQSSFGGDDLTNYDLYSDTDEKIGSVKNILVDAEGNFRYLVVDTGSWITDPDALLPYRNVLLPLGRARIDRAQNRVYAVGLTPEQAENLPEYNSDTVIDNDYEQRIRSVYQNQVTTTGDRNSYNYDREPSLYAHQETDGRQNLKLYEERLVANKERFRAGTVTVGKRVETDTATVTVPVEKERVIVERHSPSSTEVVTPGEANFNAGEVARVEIYEESADIEKQAFVREEVSVRKEIDQDTVSRSETIRREELDIESDGEVVVNGDR